jgi:hypothetical protein
VKPPADTSLPFFAYGLFRPGQLAYFQIRDYVIRIDDGEAVRGELLIRDGLPIIDESGRGNMDGAVLHFREDVAIDAYDKIAGLEPDKQYRWTEKAVETGRVNILVGISPSKGSFPL